MKPAVTEPAQGQLRVPRSATLQGESTDSQTRLLADWRDLDAYVLLGDPGAGKSCSFEAESLACGGLLIPARDIVDNVVAKPDGDTTLFIDGIDEVKAGSINGLAAIGAIRSWLHRAGNPRFRLSCREADWLGESDQSALSRVAPGQRVDVLHLQPLQQEDVFAVLRDRPAQVRDAEDFWRKAQQFDLTELFGNPLLLDLTINAVSAAGQAWPNTRQEIYEAACRQLAAESSSVHLAVKPTQPGDVDRLLNDAGLLCAVLLLSNQASWASRAGGRMGAVALSNLPPVLPLHDARAALASKVFTTVAGRSTPRHRSIAEFLAARALAACLAGGLPLGRLLALMQGFDGKPVEPLRGLFAWLVVHHAPARERLIPLDPLGLVLNGDVAALSPSERLGVLKALNVQAQLNPWFRSNAWVSHPFGPLATADMAITYKAWLCMPERDAAHQSFIDCLLDALCHGEPMPSLRTALETWVEDAAATLGNRLNAYAAWKHNAPAELQTAKQKHWLLQAVDGAPDESNARLSDALLTDLYPQHVGPNEVLKYMRPAHWRGPTSHYSMFWGDSLLRKSGPNDFAVLADAWTNARRMPAEAAQSFEVRALAGKVLAAALAHASAKINIERLCAWLDIATDEGGFSTLIDNPRREVAAWLEARPQTIKEVVAWGYQRTESSARGHRYFWQADQRLHGAKKPHDWLWWMLEQAANTTDDALAEYCLMQVAFAVLEQPTGLSVPSAEQMEQWVEEHAVSQPAARVWLQKAWTSDIKDGRGEQYQRELKYKAQQFQDLEERRRYLEPQWAGLATGNSSAGLLQQIADAYNEHFINIHGNTPLERVQNFLVSDETTARQALRAIDLVLSRSDLPSVQEIVISDAKRKHHLIRPAALLAASRLVEQTPGAALKWSNELARKLVAFYLTDGTGDMPLWYRQLAVQKPALVAPILLRYAAPKLRSKFNSAISGLWALSRDADQQALARRVLPGLLEGFPARASAAGRAELDRSLLSALHVLDNTKASRLVRRKLAQTGLDAMQRISWLVADLPYRAEAANALAAWVGANERRAMALATALQEQGSLARTVRRLNPAAVRKLIEVLAPIAQHESEFQSGPSTPAKNRAEIVGSLLAALSSDASDGARAELQALTQSDALRHWRDALAYHLQAQRSVAREAHFQAADPRAVALVLANLAPANVADLQALVVQNLIDIEADLRGANTFRLRQFWRPKDSGQVPQEENECRDQLQSQLKPLLSKVNVAIDRESSAPRDKLVDINVSFMRAGQRVSLPIEVKRASDRKLWTAWREQLQRLYLIDTDCGGYGLYLVLWFDKVRYVTPEGLRVPSAAQLYEMIVQRIPPAERTRLAVHVMDLSWPIDPA